MVRKKDLIAEGKLNMSIQGPAVLLYLYRPMQID